MIYVWRQPNRGEKEEVQQQRRQPFAADALLTRANTIKHDDLRMTLAIEPISTFSSLFPGISIGISKESEKFIRSAHMNSR